MIDYFSIIHKHIAPDSELYKVYLPHVTLVTQKALAIAQSINLSKEQLQFIEEAGMLHDIGIVKVDAPELCCTGDLDYIVHTEEGGKMLDAENLPKHARVCRTHIGVGITKEDIIERNLPLPPVDCIPETIEERIISFADKFYSKTPGNIWVNKGFEKARASVAEFGEEYAKRFDTWAQEFNETM